MSARLPAPPRRRSECVDGARPCPHRSCRYNLADERRGVRSTLDSCVLDVAERGGASQADIARMLGVSREAVRRVEERGLTKLKVLADQGIVDFPDHIFS